MAPERLVYLVDEPAEGDKRVTGRATREEIDQGARRGSRKQAGPDDVVFVTLIGHGSFDGRAAKFNLPGPGHGGRPTSTPLLEKLPTKQVVFVNTASASGPFVEALSGPGRTIVTATRNGAEQYATLFGGYFVDALTSEAADADKNKRVSVLEAFQSTPRPRWPAPTSAKGCWPPSTRCSTTTATRKAARTVAGRRRQGRQGAPIVSLGTVGDDDLPTDPKLRALLPRAARARAARRVAAAAEGQHGAGDATPPSSRSW